MRDLILTVKTVNLTKTLELSLILIAILTFLGGINLVKDIILAKF